MGIRFTPGLKAAGIDPSMIEKLVEVQKIPLNSAMKRREATTEEKKEVEKLNTLLSGLDTSLNGLKTRYDFYKLKLDSSHPDIVDGTVAAGALLGSYEMEVRAMARTEKELAYGFPDKDETPVGFGYMLIERDDGEEIEVEVEPYTTLQQLAEQINDAEAGVKAMVVNTKYYPDSYRLLVISEKSGKEAKIQIDEDTTFLEFKEQVTGRNLDVLFEDVPVTDEDNILDELIDGVTLNIRRSEPGTRIQISVVHDLDATMEGIKTFVESYNAIAGFINGQFMKDPKTGGYGLLSGDSSLKHVMRQMQNAVVGLPKGGERFNSLAEIGITTNPKTGELMMNESKVRESLTENYDSVADLFIRTKDSVGVAEALSQKVKNFRDPGFGAVKSRLRALDRIIDSQDKEIERRERQLESREAAIRRKFTALESTLADLQGQGDFIKAKFGGGGSQGQS
ncbi:MAG: flagellar filament capping protein FliD [Deltaproteobacteria bacterium]|nr:flagellar filament capping protein FliD [Deltaproteobacteria bacterium]